MADTGAVGAELKLKVLVIGAHPDDLDLGAGGLVHRLTTARHEVRLLVLTQETALGDVRRAEAQNAGENLGVHRSNINFTNFRDGYLTANRESISQVRKLFGEEWVPDVVVTHSSADSHNDHVAANSIARAAFRNAILLFFSIHISAEPSRFSPRLYSDLSDADLEAKERALACHDSQVGRISKNDLPAYEAWLGSPVGLERCEAYEVDFQVGSSDHALATLMTFNDSAFHRLWEPLLGNREIYLLYESLDGTYSHFNHESAGRDMLRESFAASWMPRSPMIERLSTSNLAVEVFKSKTVLLAGGAVSNLVVRDYLNRLPGVDWIVDFEWPEPRRIFLRRKSDGFQLSANYHGLTLKKDVGVLTLMPNPYDDQNVILSCAGVHSQATGALLRFLSAPGECPWLCEAIAPVTGIQQFVVWADADTLELEPAL